MIPITELFSDPDGREWHAFLIGIGHGFFFWQKHTCPDKDEEHYYEQGKIGGFIFFGVLVVFLGCLVIKLWF